MKKGDEMKLGMKTLIVVGLVFALGSMGSLPSAYALQLRLSDGVTTTTIIDGGSNDSNTATGAVTFIGSIGSFNIVVSTGISNPQIGSTDHPEMDLNSIEVSGSAGTLIAMLTDQDFTGIGSSLLSIGGTTFPSGNVTYDAYFDSANAAFGGVGDPSKLLGTSGLLSGPAFSKTVSGAAPSGASYSLTQVVRIVHTGFGVSSLDAHLSVPEPSLSLLLGMSLVGLVGYGCSCWRREQ